MQHDDNDDNNPGDDPNSGTPHRPLTTQIATLTNENAAIKNELEKERSKLQDALKSIADLQEKEKKDLGAKKEVSEDKGAADNNKMLGVLNRARYVVCMFVMLGGGDSFGMLNNENPSPFYLLF